MPLNIAINGFGRIGRNVLRAAFEKGRQGQDINIVAINDLAPLDTNAHLLKYDSTHGTFGETVEVVDGAINVGGHSIKVFAERDPANLPWGDLEIDIVFECTGIFRGKADASKHLDGGAKKVIISAPGKDVDLTCVFGVNNDQLTDDMTVISNASCTTNCLAPVAYVLDKAVGIDHGFMTTIHSYTSDQRIVDTFHSDPYRARAAGTNLIPTSTGAAGAVGLVLPELNGKLDGVSIRVPTPNVSLIDFTFVAKKATTVEEINTAINTAANGELKGVLGVNDLPLVSGDFNHNSNSSTFDSTGTKVMEGTFVRILSWYDNEWGFSCRMLDTAAAWGATMGKCEAPSLAA